MSSGSCDGVARSSEFPPLPDVTPHQSHSAIGPETGGPFRSCSSARRALRIAASAKAIAASRLL